MKIEKHGNVFCVRKKYKNKTYTVTFPHKPTQKEVLQALAEKMESVETKTEHLTFKDGAKKYVDMKRNVLSPKTVKEYSEIPDRLDDWFNNMIISDITQIDINKQINSLSKDKSPKTVRNYHGFISSVLKTFRPAMVISTTLPQKVKDEPYIPSDEDIKKILKAAEGTKYEIPLKLACYGMRRGEILALTPKDIDGTTVHINKALVINSKNEWVVKSTKTTYSTRDIIISKDLAEMIIEQNYTYKGTPDNINHFVTRAEKRLGLPHFSLHKFRHYFCSKLVASGVDIKTIQKLGGWETDTVPRQVYSHCMKDKYEEAKKDAADLIAKTLFF